MRTIEEYGKQYKCWSPEEFSHDETDAYDICGFDEEDAAREYAEYMYNAGDTFDNIDVMVRAVETGKLHKFNFVTEFEVNFCSVSSEEVKEG